MRNLSIKNKIKELYNKLSLNEIELFQKEQLPVNYTLYSKSKAISTLYDSGWLVANPATITDTGAVTYPTRVENADIYSYVLPDAIGSVNARDMYTTAKKGLKWPCKLVCELRKELEVPEFFRPFVKAQLLVKNTTGEEFAPISYLPTYYRYSTSLYYDIQTNGGVNVYKGSYPYGPWTGSETNVNFAYTQGQYNSIFYFTKDGADWRYEGYVRRINIYKNLSYSGAGSGWEYTLYSVATSMVAGMLMPTITALTDTTVTATWNKTRRYWDSGDSVWKTESLGSETSTQSYRDLSNCNFVEVQGRKYINNVNQGINSWGVYTGTDIGSTPYSSDFDSIWAFTIYYYPTYVVSGLGTYDPVYQKTFFQYSCSLANSNITVNPTGYPEVIGLNSSYIVNTQPANGNQQIFWAEDKNAGEANKTATLFFKSSILCMIPATYDYQTKVQYSYSETNADGDVVDTEGPGKLVPYYGAKPTPITYKILITLKNPFYFNEEKKQ